MGEVVSYDDEVMVCNFCGKSEEQVTKLIAGPGVAICDECVAICTEILQEHQQEDAQVFSDHIPTPRAIYDYLEQYVVGQYQAKRTLAVAVHNHYKRVVMQSYEQFSNQVEQHAEQNTEQATGQLRHNVPSHQQVFAEYGERHGNTSHNERAYDDSAHDDALALALHTDSHSRLSSFGQGLHTRGRQSDPTKGEQEGYRQGRKLAQLAKVFGHVRIDKSNVLMLGPTGVGKTYLARTLADVMHVPFALTDATTLTEAGYVGDDVETVLQRLIQAADGDIERAQSGIIYIDEIDKIARKSGENTSITRDVSGEGVQQALLKIIEGTVASVPVEGSRKHRDLETVQIDTRNILFMFGGAFVGLEDIIERRLGKHESGFVAPGRRDELDHADGNALLHYVTGDDLIEFGMLPEFIGRIPIRTVLDELQEQDLTRILCDPVNALTKQYQKLFAFDGITLDFQDDAITQIAHIAKSSGTGARGLRSIIEHALEETMFQLPELHNVSRIIVDADVIEGRERPRVEYRTAEA